MSSKLEQLRAKLRNSANNGSKQDNDKTYFQHWNMEVGESAKLRFLPDGNESSVEFWAEKRMINLPFAGVVGMDPKPCVVKVPCMQMYGERCPITDENATLWKTDEDTARKYYRKKSFIFHGFVRQSTIQETGIENPIRRFIFNQNIAAIITAGILDEEMEDMPYDLENGTDFIVNKTQSGKWANYDTSRWARKPSSLTDEELDAIKKFGIPSLNSYLPAKPTPEMIDIMMDMYVDSLNGDLYDPEKYGKFFRPAGVELVGFNQHGKKDDAEVDEDVSKAKVSSAAKTKKVPAPVSEEEDDGENPYERHSSSSKKVVETLSDDDYEEDDVSPRKSSKSTPIVTEEKQSKNKDVLDLLAKLNKKNQ